MLGEFISKGKNSKTLWFILGLCVLLIAVGLIFLKPIEHNEKEKMVENF